MYRIKGLHHASFLVSELARAERFYTGILGMEILPRPDLGYPGLWLKLGPQQQLHLMELPDPDFDRERPQHGGRDRHIALHIDNLEALVERLQQGQIPYTLSRSGRRALFCRDPDGNAIEFIEESGQ
ncbi:MAG: VOC family protein [Gammaproteobacteria bacterium]|nr:VOC family protein [Gammaproteobacteria bacterium]